MKKFIPRALALLILISLPGSASRLANAQPNFIALHPGQFQQIDQNIKLTSCSSATIREMGHETFRKSTSARCCLRPRLKNDSQRSSTKLMSKKPE
jgi:hypothetical protein